MKNLTLSFLIVTLLSFTACEKDKTVEPATTDTPTGKVELVFKAKAGTDSLILGNEYTNPNGEEYVVNKLKFFLSNIGLSKFNAKENPAIADDKGVFLIDFTNPNYDAGYGLHCYKISFDAKTGDYADIRFHMGVPRELNHGDPTKAKSPLDLSQADMYWSWNSGYIFLLAEGSGDDVNGNSFHLGVGADSRIMPCAFGNMLSTTPKFTVKEGETTRIIFEFDFHKLLTNADSSPYSFATSGACNVHGGAYADDLKSNAIKAMSFKSATILD